MDELYNIKGYVAENNDNLKKDSILVSNILNKIDSNLYWFLIEYKNHDGVFLSSFRPFVSRKVPMLLQQLTKKGKCYNQSNK